MIDHLVRPLLALPHQRCELDRPAAAHVDARHALADRAHDLVGNRLAPARHLLDGQRIVMLVAEDHHLVADRGRRSFREIHHGEVHRHASQDRHAATAHQHVAAVREQPRVAVAVAHRHNAHPDRARRSIRAPVAHGRAGRQVAHLDQPALERHHRLDRRLGHAVRRPMAVRDEADTHRVEVALREVQRAGAVGGMRARRP